MTLTYIAPAAPTLRPRPPTGREWLHEIKFDGWRIQLHKHGADVAIYSRKGHSFTRQLSYLADQLRRLPARSAIIDAELTACDDRGLPDFNALHFRNWHRGREHILCAWAFDLLSFNERDLRDLPLTKRKQRLALLLHKTDRSWLRYSDAFADGCRLLAEADKLGLEGIVSKRRTDPYRSGEQSGWIKVKCATWRERNRERWRWFERST